MMRTEREGARRGLTKRLLVGFVKVVGVVAILYWLLPWVGLGLMRVSRKPVPLEGSELAHSRAVTPRRSPQAIRPVNVILFVADGLGFAHLSAARAALHGMGESAVWDRFATTGWHRTHAAAGFLVDSAASATALATGVPTLIGGIGVDVNNAALPNLFARGNELGYRCGIVTDSYIWDATPAAFAAHAASRDDAVSILGQLAESPIEILVGELEDVGEDGVPTREATVARFEKNFRVFGPDPGSTERFLEEGSRGGPVAALFDEDQVNDLASMPTLPQLVRVALQRLPSDDRPFLLLVESEEADSASHGADFARLLRGMEAMEATLEVILDFAEQEGSTLVVFTSDHETGGLALSIPDKANSAIKALWPTSSHTGVAVPVLAMGPGAERFGGIHATWELGRVLDEMLTRPAEAHEISTAQEQAE